MTQDGGVDYEIEVKEIPEQHAVVIRETTTAKGLAQVFRNLYPEIGALLDRRGIEPAGPSFALYHSYSEDEVELEAGFPVAEMVQGEGRIRSIRLPGGRAAVTVHVGPYTTLGDAHEAMDAFVHGREGEHAAPPREVYVVGPGEDPDSSKWRTEVIYPF
jgi:AraC family transcriptional regulator